MLFGYARVSTADQNPDHQIDALLRAGVDRENIRIDKASGAKASRPKLDLVLQLLREGDTLKVTRLDRLSRSVLHLVTLGAELRERGIGLHVIEQAIDTSTMEGRAMFGVLSVLAELQRELIVANTNDGLASARARGRRPKLTPDQAALAQQLYDAREKTVQQIADSHHALHRPPVQPDGPQQVRHHEAAELDLLPRIKRINKVKLYRPTAGDPDAYPQLTPALTRPIRWELITQQYNQKYGTAIRTRTASTEAILRRFTRNASHPTYAAMLEVGRAQKTIFVARYMRLRDLLREIEEGLNVMESSNDANSVIAYGKGGEIASNRRDEQEMFVLCLRILQSALVYVNTLMLQDILGEPEWADLLTPADRRGLNPLFWSHVRPYGDVNLDMDTRLNLAPATVPGPWGADSGVQPR